MSNLSFIREPFTERERAILSNYFTNTDKPVFGLINLPDVVKGALFARYSRSDKSLRRLFLDEFWIDTPDSAGTCTTGGLNTERAGRLYDKMILDFGDDSVAQLGGAHLACEQVSNLLAKFIEKGRIASYLEQSTRYVYYNRKREGRYGYLTSPEIESSSCCALYREFMDALFDTYTDLQQRLIPVFRERYPRTEGMTDGAWENTIKAKACDTIRGLLPASTRTNLGIFANGQYYEYLLIKMFASRNREVLAYADMMLTELRKMIPSFLTRVDLENRGRAWSRYLSDIGDDMERFVPQPGAVLPASPQPNTVELVGWDPDAVRRIVRAILYEYSDRSKTQLDQTVSRLTEPELGQIVRAYCGERLNRRHKPGRAFEAASYEFDLLSDYGAFRDIQRHRMLTIDWQRLTTDNGYFKPAILEELPAEGALYDGILRRAQQVFETLRRELGPDTAQYAVPFAFRLRYAITMNLREAFHLIELRTQRQGHDSYRRICLRMYELMRDRAGQGLLTDGMLFVDDNFYDLARAEAEKRKSAKKGQ